MSFSASWLALREPADHRARDPNLAQELARYLSRHAIPKIMDLGCGSGSNLRALAPFLGAQQDWTLVDYDPLLLDAARSALKKWADKAVEEDGSLILKTSGKTLKVAFQQADLSQGLAPLLRDRPDCITASALFDLCSPNFIQQAASDIAAARAAFYTVLTYDGVEHWSPAHEADHDVLAAFIAHQKTDKGFGVSAGPDAPRILSDAFERAGYAVHETSTPWQLEAPRDSTLMAELASGIAHAAFETGRVLPERVEAWRNARKNASAASIGHRDLLALPRA